MQDIANFQAAFQPLAKLSQANVQLLAKFAQSPEVTSQAISDAQQLFQQAQASALKLAHSQAFAGLMQGMVQNYTEFFSELGYGAAGRFSEAQAAFIQQTQEASTKMVDAAQGSAKRLRSAA